MDRQSYNKHKFNIFPEMSSDEMGQLVDDLRVHGYDGPPITLYENEILDGWNRYLACDTVGIDFPVQEFSGTDSDALDFVVRANRRRNLTKNQWTLCIGELYELKKNPRGNPNFSQLGQNVRIEDDEDSGPLSDELIYEYEDTAADVAKQFGVNPRTVRRAAHTLKAFREAEPEKQTAFQAGRMSQKAIIYPSPPPDERPKFDKREMKRLIGVIAFEVEVLADSDPDLRAVCDKVLDLCREAQAYTGV